MSIHYVERCIIDTVYVYPLCRTVYYRHGICLYIMPSYLPVLAITFIMTWSGKDSDMLRSAGVRV